MGGRVGKQEMSLRALMKSPLGKALEATDPVVDGDSLVYELEPRRLGALGEVLRAAVKTAEAELRYDGTLNSLASLEPLLKVAINYEKNCSDIILKIIVKYAKFEKKGILFFKKCRVFDCIVTVLKMRYEKESDLNEILAVLTNAEKLSYLVKKAVERALKERACEEERVREERC